MLNDKEWLLIGLPMALIINSRRRLKIQNNKNSTPRIYDAYAVIESPNIDLMIRLPLFLMYD